uniref:Uncharacterized protein n=1 Tax=Alexandrium catenella TaxID=2925 RepID=A0A7S1MA82_ALECA
MVRAEVAFAAGGAAVYSLGRAFVPGSAGNSIQPAPALRVAPAQQLSAAGAAESACMAAAAAVTTAAVGMAALRRQGRAAESRVARSAGRRELAIAYEDSGISLLDNGKFAQGLVGSEGAWGTYEFDPVGFSKYTELVPFFREAELKHGRVCMLAAAGWMATDLGVRFPGEMFQDVSTVKAHDAMVNNGLMGPFLATIAAYEVYGGWLCLEGFEGKINREAGDFFLGKNFLPKDEAQASTMKLKELENGRLAMLAFSGICTQSVLTGEMWPFF